MQYVVSNQQMKEAERRCNESGTSYYQMMENAGTRCAEFILGTIPVSADILVMCGRREQRRRRLSYNPGC